MWTGWDTVAKAWLHCQVSSKCCIMGTVDWADRAPGRSGTMQSTKLLLTSLVWNHREENWRQVANGHRAMKFLKKIPLPKYRQDFISKHTHTYTPGHLVLLPRPRDLLWKERTRGRFFNLTAERMSARRPVPMNLSSRIWRNLQERLVPPWLFWRFALCRHVPKSSRGNFQKGMSRNKLELQWNSLRTFSRVRKGMISEWGKRNTMLCNKKLFLV